MNIDLLSADDLPAELIARWHELQSQTPELASPYFRPEFVQAVAAVRPNVEAAVLRDGDRVVGFFPFERYAGSIARPVGGRLSDYQGVIATAALNWRIEDILRGCQLKAWEFDHQLACQHQLAPFFAKAGQSRQLNLSAGYDTWLESRRAAAKTVNETLRKFRKLQRDYTIRFVWHTSDEAVFQQLMIWKSEQYRRTGADDLFANQPIVALLRRIWQTQQPHFAGVLSALYANDNLAAVHFSMQSGPMLHSWFPAYDPALGKHSPGASLLLSMAQEAVEHGATCIDLGKGDEEYKLALASDSVPLGEGVVETRAIAGAVRMGWRVAKDWVKQTPLKAPAKASLRWLRSMQTWIGAAR